MLRMVESREEANDGLQVLVFGLWCSVEILDEFSAFH